MKNIYKLLILVFTINFFVGCDKPGVENDFSNDPNTGWIQFVDASSADINLSDYDTSIPFTIPVRMEVPYNLSGLTIDYAFSSVSGPDPNNFFSNTGEIVVPAGTGGQALIDGILSINLDINEVNGLTEAMVFDVALQGTSSPNVSIGISGSEATRPTRHRVTICPSATVFTSTNNVAIGNYTLTVPTGAGPFGASFTDGQTVNIVEGANGVYSRAFDVVYLPGFQADLMTITFDITPNGLVVGSGLNTDIGCTSFILIGGDPNNVAAVPCGDGELTLNVLDFEGGSGGCGQADVPMTILLTKQ